MGPTTRGAGGKDFGRVRDGLSSAAGSGPRRKDHSPDSTHAEASYYSKQVEGRRPLVVRFRDGEELRGVLEWYDRGCLRLGLPDGSHRIVPKRAIAYLWRESS